MSVRYYCDRCGDPVERYERIAVQWTGPKLPSLSCFARPGEMDHGQFREASLIVCDPCNEAIARAFENIMRPCDPREG